MKWLNNHLSRRFSLFLIGVLGITSLAFLAILLLVYSQHLTRERAQASQSVNFLLQAALENAMLMRDLDGLRGIVSRLGQQSEIRDVVILNSKGEIRFSARPSLLGQQAVELLAQTCNACRDGEIFQAPISQFTLGMNGGEVLRTFNPVKNRAPCQQCHGPMTSHPVNGVLVVDYDAASIKEKARASLIGLSGAGALVLGFASLAAYWFMGRFVLQPVAALDAASQALSAGVLTTRVEVRGNDEMARLGSAFNAMAEHLQQSYRTLEQREQFLQGVIDAVPDGIRVIDSDFTIVAANRAYGDQVGQTADQAVRRRCHASSHGRDSPCPPTLITCPLHEVQKSAEPIKCSQQFTRANGQRLAVEVYAAPMRIERDGRADSLVVESIRDMAKAVQYSHEQKLADLGELAAGIAHEIHNPLNSVRIALQAILNASRGQEPDAETIEEYLQLVEHEIDACIQVTQRLLKLSALSGERPELVALNPAVEETLALLRYEGEQLGIRVVLELDAANPRLLASESDVRMVVMNLAQNAFHAMPRGGSLWIRTRGKPHEVCLQVEDEGVGISPHNLARIFDPFFSQRADGKKGTGLGLTIVKSLVERHHGSIEVHSEVSKGTCFQILFPSADHRLSQQENSA